MSEQVLDLVGATERNPVKIDDGPLCYMANPDELSPRDFAKMGRLEELGRGANLEQFDEDAAEEMERAMTQAAQIVLPDESAERLAAIPYLRRARLVEAFVKGPVQNSRQTGPDDSP